MSEDHTPDFSRDVFPAEQQQIRERRENLGLDASRVDGPPSAQQGLTGLALSGGGIRSATFSLGVIQGLARHGILKHVDYLSTVSGGGYIGATLSALLNDPKNRPEGDEFPLRYTSGNAEPPALGHLRNSSNYLSPAGLLPRLRLPNLMLRGILLNLFVFMPYIMSAVLLTEIAYEWGPHWDGLPKLLLPLVLAFVLMALAFPFLIRMMRSVFNWRRRNAYELWLTIPLLLAVIVLIAIPLLHITRLAIEHSTGQFIYWFQTLSPGELWKLAAVLLGLGTLFMFAGKASENVGKLTGKLVLLVIGMLGPVIVFAIFLGLCLWQVDSPFLPAKTDVALNAAAQCAQPCVAPPSEEEILEDHVQLTDSDDGLLHLLLHRESGPNTPEELGVAMNARGLPLSNQATVECLTGNCAPLADDAHWRNDERYWLITDPVVVNSSARRASVAPEGFVCPPWDDREARAGEVANNHCIYIQRISADSLRIEGPEIHFFASREDKLFIALFVALLVINWFLLNINITSPHGFYRDRLSRAFLFRQTPDGTTEPQDDLLLSQLNAPGTTAPLHLINVAMNLQGSNDPALRGRECDFFTFSRNFCGGRRTGWTRTEAMEKFDRHLDLATAIAISGAAAAPNMGSTTQRPLVFIMTLLNIRLGYWLPNPRKINGKYLFKRLRLGNARPGLIWKEALGRLNARGSHVNVSDGGHIENLAIYQLLKRQCKFIVAVDGECDPLMQFNGLTTLMRYARIDMGVEINMDLAHLRRNEAGMTENHWVLGDIRYADGTVGQLLYIKLSMTGDEPEYVRAYHHAHPDFPHQSTADQFFSEAQFEAYRALGEHACEGMLADVKQIGGFAALSEGPQNTEHTA